MIPLGEGATVCRKLSLEVPNPKRLEPSQRPFLAVWPWVSHLNSLGYFSEKIPQLVYISKILSNSERQKEVSRIPQKQRKKKSNRPE